MIELAENFLKEVLLKIVNRDCPYYPCHFEGQTCLWCFCPFYPCEDESLGEYIEGKHGKVWSCEKCHWIHSVDIAIEVYKEIAYLIRYLPTEEAIKLLDNHKVMLGIKDKVMRK
ncbi:cysteine-rich small domain protein [Methanocaldococcus infernus ME]|uniref:Cysteine-rich small domain protein n=1 Tax=Methanocaldococcus infernus (strain DSM 11812 / JCM 15783 / ME) TaxID=573063 RepID=D5VTU4_METIM|nr:cysteine-rich small domain-containing protein [Methanocaldococcus infernus]ADG13997.1 cysteine-rich small domain protein [Methanocaldococcus infernus ME]